jgi:hypothetical protein
VQHSLLPFLIRRLGRTANAHSDDMSSVSGSPQRSEELQELRSKCDEASAALQPQSEAFGLILGRNAEVSIRNCSNISLLDRLQLQNKLSLGYVRVGRLGKAAALDLDIEQSIQQLEDTEETRALQRETALRRRNLDPSPSGFVDSQFSTIQPARYGPLMHQGSECAPDDRVLQADHAEPNEQNSVKNAAFLPSWNNASPISSATQRGKSFPETNSDLLTPSPHSRYKTVSATYDSMIQMDSLHTGSLASGREFSSKGISTPLLNDDLPPSKQAGEYLSFANQSQGIS